MRDNYDFSDAIPNKYADRVRDGYSTPTTRGEQPPAKLPDAATSPPLDTPRLGAFCQRWGIAELSLFGSILRDDFRPDSDVDVLISFHPATDWDYWNWPDMLDGLQAIFGRPVDLVVKESLRNPFRRHRILTERKIVHAA